MSCFPSFDINIIFVYIWFFCWFNSSIIKYCKIISANDRFPTHVKRYCHIYLISASQMNVSLLWLWAGMWDRGESALSAHVSGLAAYDGAYA